MITKTTMRKKKYEVPGMMEWHPVFRVGRTRMQVSFTGGHMCGGGSTPASYHTSDPVVQAVIEKSEAFRSGRIRLGITDCNDGGAVARPPSQTHHEVFEYSDKEQIYDYLEHEKGVPVEELCDDDSCFRVARRLGIVLNKLP